MAARVTPGRVMQTRALDSIVSSFLTCIPMSFVASLVRPPEQAPCLGQIRAVRVRALGHALLQAIWLIERNAETLRAHAWSSFVLGDAALFLGFARTQI